MKSYPKAKVMELCRELGHEPEDVSSILIEPSTITVMHVIPITGWREPDVIGVE